MQVPNIVYFILLLTTFFVFIFSATAIIVEIVKKKKSKNKPLTEIEQLNNETLTDWNKQRAKAREESRTKIDEHTKAKIVEIEYHEDEYEKPKQDHPYNRNLIKFK